MNTFVSVSHPEECFSPDESSPDDWWVRHGLTPGYRCGPDSWWTGHPDIAPGDEVFLYVTNPFKAIHFLLRAIEAPVRITEAQSPQRAGKWGFRFETLFYFPEGLTIAEMRTMPHLAGWSPLRANLQGTGFHIPATPAAAIRQALATKDAAYARFLHPPPPTCPRCFALLPDHTRPGQRRGDAQPDVARRRAG